MVKEDPNTRKTIEVKSVEEFLSEQKFYSETDYFRGHSPMYEISFEQK